MRKKGAKTARVSGWCAFSEWALRSVDAGFPISDHSDFSGTMKFVEECNPKQVYAQLSMVQQKNWQNKLRRN